MTYKDNSIYIVPNDIKKDLLLDLSKEKELKNIKFFSLKEFINNLTFSYDERRRNLNDQDRRYPLSYPALCG